MSARKVLCTAILGVAVAGLAVVGGANAAYPEKPIKIIVPTDVGGAIDAIARIFQKAWEEKGILPHGAAVVNMSGAGGAIGTRAIKDAEPDGYTIGLWHDGLVTSKAMGVTDFDQSAFEILGNTGYDSGGFGVVPEKSGINSFEEFVAKAKASPDTVTFSTNVGLPVHFYPMLVAKGAGIKLRFVQSGGGSKRLHSILGGHTDSGMLSLLEFVKNKPTGLKPILVLADKRHKLFPDVPIPADFGIDVDGRSSRIWLAPKGVPADRLNILADGLRTVMADPDVQARFVKLGMDPDFTEPADVLKALDKTLSQISPLVDDARSVKK